MVDSNRRLRVDVRLKRAFVTGTLPRELLICGPAGTGKTFGILSILHQLAADYANLRILIVRKTRVSLSDSALVTYEQEVLPADGMESVAVGQSRRHRSSYLYPNGSEIVLAGMDDPIRVGSTSWDIVYPNEAIQLGEDDWETIGSRLNRPGRPAWLGYLIGDTNPGDPSHWLKTRCDDGRTALWDTAHEANPALHDGRDWTEAGRLYLDRLGRLRGTREKRLRRGLWAAGEGQWFETFDDRYVSDRAEFDPRFEVHHAVDPGVHTGAVWFQVRETGDGPLVTVFGDYYSRHRSYYDAARELLDLGRTLGAPRFDRGTVDGAYGNLTGFGITGKGEYRRAGLYLDDWPKYPGSVVDGLNLIESFVAVDPPALLVHPRCTHLINAFANYKRAKRGGQWIDRPEEPQHPYEELLDSLRGGLQDKYPEGRKPEPKLRWTPARGGRLR
jgi:hypothetical protein